MGPPAGNDELEVAEEEPKSIRGEGGSDGLLAMATGDSKGLPPPPGMRCDAGVPSPTVLFRRRDK